MKDPPPDTAHVSEDLDGAVVVVVRLAGGMLLVLLLDLVRFLPTLRFLRFVYFIRHQCRLMRFV